ncbi:CUB and sushi domain-containing protein 3 [Nematostella vectensis]|uniref:CUB and sushi domain-containing protein 3 n=1 Tax=Nematostella vectensis TaxID=45351 RepID=UPI00138FE846|nr:CUB and sushi domain-containing protein 3 [Nematostella vectensis]
MIQRQSVLLALCIVCSSAVKSAFGQCRDPGTPTHGQRSISPAGQEPFPSGTLIRFTCDSNYQLSGARKIQCESNGEWSSKMPSCHAQLCPPQAPKIPYSTLLTAFTPGVTNQIGSILEYACNGGFTAHGTPTYLCDKDGVWKGNFVCEVVKCPPPFVPDNGNVSYTSRMFNSIAHYKCGAGFYLYGRSNSSCTQQGTWTPAPRCLVICDEPGDLEHGTIYTHPPPQMPYVTELVMYTFLTFRCDPRYSLHGSEKRVCMPSGRWSVDQPICVVSSCGSPGDFSQNGQMTYSRSPPTIGTIVRFRCHHGYRLVGTQTRTCLPSGHWTSTRNPTCTEIFCEEPDIQNGYHDNKEISGIYKHGTTINYQCNHKFYLWGNKSRQCSSQNGVAFWTGVPPLCLTLVQFDKRCHEAGGKFVMKTNTPDCIVEVTLPPTLSSRTRINSNELDTLTIVTASAGSTLGALVILLSILIFVRRCHRSRRYRNSTRRSFYSEDDRLTLIATYSGDVHFQLPSYDEAMSQVERAPPPFELVISEVTNNNPTAEIRDDVVDSAVVASSEEVPITEGSLPDSEEQINIVSNPLAEHGPSQGEEQQGNFNYGYSDDTPPSPPSVSARGSISDEEQSTNEARPLINSV